MLNDARHNVRPLRGLQRSVAEQKVDDAAFVRLEPVEFGGGERAEIQAVDMSGVNALALELFVVGDDRTNQRRADLRQHLVLRAFDDRAEGEHVLLLRRRAIRRVAVQDRGPQVVA